MLNELYIRDEEDVAPFGNNWIGPDKFEEHRETLVARYEKTCDDGQTVEVYCTAAPARFYTVKALAGGNALGGGPKAAFELGTGSGHAMAVLAAAMAEAIAGGMLGLASEMK